MKKEALVKPKYKRITDPDEIAKYIVQGKYRDSLPHLVRTKDGLLVEVK